MSFLMDPGPPSPSISALLTKFGKAFGKTLLKSKAMALYSFEGATAQSCSRSVVKIPMIFNTIKKHKGLIDAIRIRKYIRVCKLLCTEGI